MWRVLLDGSRGLIVRADFPIPPGLLESIPGVECTHQLHPWTFVRVNGAPMEDVLVGVTAALDGADA